VCCSFVAVVLSAVFRRTSLSWLHFMGLKSIFTVLADIKPTVLVSCPHSTEFPHCSPSRLE